MPREALHGENNSGQVGLSSFPSGMVLLHSQGKVYLRREEREKGELPIPHQPRSAYHNKAGKRGSWMALTGVPPWKAAIAALQVLDTVLSTRHRHSLNSHNYSTQYNNYCYPFPCFTD